MKRRCKLVRFEYWFLLKIVLNWRQNYNGSLEIGRDKRGREEKNQSEKMR